MGLVKWRREPKRRSQNPHPLINMWRHVSGHSSRHARWCYDLVEGSISLFSPFFIRQTCCGGINRPWGIPATCKGLATATLSTWRPWDPCEGVVLSARASGDAISPTVQPLPPGGGGTWSQLLTSNPRWASGFGFLHPSHREFGFLHPSHRLFNVYL